MLHGPHAATPLKSLLYPTRHYETPLSENEIQSRERERDSLTAGLSKAEVMPAAFTLEMAGMKMDPYLSKVPGLSEEHARQVLGLLELADSVTPLKGQTEQAQNARCDRHTYFHDEVFGTQSSVSKPVLLLEASIPSVSKKQQYFQEDIKPLDATVLKKNLISPLAIRFTQESIRTTFEDGRALPDSIASIKTRPGDGQKYDLILCAPFPAIQIIRCPGVGRLDPDGDQWFTFDNRRLFCLQRAAAAHWPSRVAVVVEVVYRADTRKFDTNTEGTSVNVQRCGVLQDQSIGRWDWQAAVTRISNEAASAGFVSEAHVLAAFAIAADCKKQTADDLVAAECTKKSMNEFMETSEAAVGLMPALMRKLPQTHQEEMPCKRLDKLLSGTWAGQQGETYEIKAYNDFTWNCIKHSSGMQRKYCIEYDCDTRCLWFRVEKRVFIWWGADWTFFMNPDELQLQPEQAVWYPAKDFGKQVPKAQFSWQKTSASQKNIDVGYLHLDLHLHPQSSNLPSPTHLAQRKVVDTEMGGILEDHRGDGATRPQPGVPEAYHGDGATCMPARQSIGKPYLALASRLGGTGCEGTPPSSGNSDANFTENFTALQNGYKQTKNCNVTASGFPTTMMPTTKPMPPCVYESQQVRQPQLVTPCKSRAKGEKTYQEKLQLDDQRLSTSTEKFEEAAAVPSEGITTLMMRGIPCSFSAEDVMSRIDDAGLKGKYNFFYLPRDASRNTNLGYAFINFINQQNAELCTDNFKGVQLARYRSAKTCTIAPASIQGLPNLWKHFRNTAVSRGSNGPMFLDT